MTTRPTSQLCIPAAALSVALLGAACGGATGDEAPAGASSGSSSGGSSGSSTGQGPVSGGSAWAFPCGAAVQQKTLDIGVAPRCIGPGCAGSPECAPQDVTFWYEVLTPAHRCANRRDIFVWDGRACTSHSTIDAKGATLHCKGMDCGKTFESKEACDAATTTCFDK